MKKRILEVSDEVALRAINTAVGESLGFDVVQASHGDEALRLYRESGPFAVVLTDLFWYDHVPEPRINVQTIRDGVQLAFEIRKLSPEQKIIIHTAGDAEGLTKGTGLPILSKPYSTVELKSFIETLRE
jgi:CheY-like chemotaxis protein